MWKNFVLPAALLTAFAVFAGTARAEDAAAPATADDIAGWIKALDDDSYAVRQSAQRSLEDAGAAAIDALKGAIAGSSVEAAARALEVLEGHYADTSRDASAPAEAALKAIAAGANPIAARRAKNVLETARKKETDAPTEPQPQDQPQFGGIRLGGGGVIRLEARAIAVGGKGGHSITIKNVDGNKEIEVSEEGKEVKITESKEGKIKVQVTEKKDGKEETKSYEAESADDLKKIHPDGYEVYEKYSKGGIGGRVEIRAFDGGALPAPRILPRLRPLPAPKAEDGAEAKPDALDEALARSIKQLLETRARLEANDAVPAEALERLNKTIADLEARLKKDAVDE
ncbi:MAG: hypothetical protein KDA41_20735 [Planctomycetales bacterium]|nr:hypothetical protein [Planctomycetales bacterium]